MRACVQYVFFSLFFTFISSNFYKYSLNFDCSAIERVRDKRMTNIYSLLLNFSIHVLTNNFSSTANRLNSSNEKCLFFLLFFRKQWKKAAKKNKRETYFYRLFSFLLRERHAITRIQHAYSINTIDIKRPPFLFSILWFILYLWDTSRGTRPIDCEFISTKWTISNEISLTCAMLV